MHLFRSINIRNAPLSYLFIYGCGCLFGCVCVPERNKNTQNHITVYVLPANNVSKNGRSNPTEMRFFFLSSSFLRTASDDNLTLTTHCFGFYLPFPPFRFYYLAANNGSTTLWEWLGYVAIVGILVLLKWWWSWLTTACAHTIHLSLITRPATAESRISSPFTRNRSQTEKAPDSKANKTKNNRMLSQSAISFLDCVPLAFDRLDRVDYEIEMKCAEVCLW